MTTDTIPSPLPRMVDLTGLPEPVVVQVHRLVNDARAIGAGNAPPLPVPEAPRYVHVPPPLTDEEFDELLDHMASLSSGQSLPADWSRADLYEDHD